MCCNVITQNTVITNRSWFSQNALGERPRLFQRYKHTKHFRPAIVTLTEFYFKVQVDFWFPVICPPSTSSAVITGAPLLHLRPPITAHLSCHSSYHSLSWTPPPPPSLFLLLLLSLIYRRRCAVHTHSTSDTPARLATGLSYRGSSFVFMILGWREEESEWARRTRQ